MKLYLFDIDGTLTHSQGIGRQCLQQALQELTSCKISLNTHDVAGQTDLGILETIRWQFSLDFNTEQVLKKYLQFLSQQIQEPQFLPGALTLLQALEQNPENILGLLTGNVQEGAKIKLGEKVFSKFRIVATGDLSPRREDLIDYALQKFYTIYQREPQETIVIGDTPQDISCAQHRGATSIVVCTGPYRKEELASADMVLNSLEEFFMAPHYMRFVY